MASIRLLPIGVQRDVAAAYRINDVVVAVRDLITNSIDAGSTEVCITIDGTKGKVTVEDDGEGIPYGESFTLLGTNGATSKVIDQSPASKLHNVLIGSQGFALSALIQLCSTVVVYTRTETEEWSREKQWLDGKVKVQGDAAVQLPGHGTRVVIENLFHNMAVRKMFGDYKKTVQSIVEMVGQFAVARPRIRFQLYDAQSGHSHPFSWDRVQTRLERFTKIVEKQTGFENLRLKRIRCRDDSSSVTGDAVLCTTPMSCLFTNILMINSVPFPPEEVMDVVHRKLRNRITTLLRESGQNGRRVHQTDPNRYVDRHGPFYLDIVTLSDNYDPEFSRVGTLSQFHLANELDYVLESLASQIAHTVFQQYGYADQANIKAARHSTLTSAKRIARTIAKKSMNLGSSSGPNTVQLSTPLILSKCQDQNIKSTSLKSVLTLTQKGSGRKSIRPLPNLDTKNMSLASGDLRFDVSFFKDCRVLAQIDRKYIPVVGMAEDGDTGKVIEVLAFVDQHAADERIIFEKLLHMATSEASRRSTAGAPCHEISLTKPIALPMHARIILPPTVRHQVVAEKFASRLNRWGFGCDVEKVSEATRADSECSSFALRVYEAPDVVLRNASGRFARMPVTTNKNICPVQDAESLDASVPQFDADVIRRRVQEMVCECVEEGSLAHLPLHSPPAPLHRALASRACHSALRFGQVLDSEQAKDVVFKLNLCKLPFQCAHGRPTIHPIHIVEPPQCGTGTALCGVTSTVPSVAETCFESTNRSSPQTRRQERRLQTRHQCKRRRNHTKIGAASNEVRLAAKAAVFLNVSNKKQQSHGTKDLNC
eukprot:Clim_evm28s227 gene=Clim_evmTU28s227